MNDAGTIFSFSRKFWLTIYSFLLLFSLIFFTALVNPPFTLESVYYNALFSLGSGLLILIGASLAAQTGALIASLIFLALYTFTVYRLIRHKHVHQAILWLLLLIISIGLIYAFMLGGFYI